MRHRAGIQMVAREGDRRGQVVFAHHAIDRQRQLGSLAMPEPGDARR